MVLCFKQEMRRSFLKPLVSSVIEQGPRFTARAEDGGDKRLVEMNLLAKLMVLHRQILFSLAIASIYRK